LEGVADEVVCAHTPEPFYAVGLWYADFSQTTDAEVRDLLKRAEEQTRVSKGGGDDPQTEIGRVPAVFAQGGLEDREA
jgi:hypothetical protein